MEVLAFTVSSALAEEFAALSAAALRAADMATQECHTNDHEYGVILESTQSMVYP